MTLSDSFSNFHSNLSASLHNKLCNNSFVEFLGSDSMMIFIIMLVLLILIIYALASKYKVDAVLSVIRELKARIIYLEEVLSSKSKQSSSSSGSKKSKVDEQ